MKNYIAPEMEIVKFSAQDIITLSGTPELEEKDIISFKNDNTGEYSYVGLN